MFEPDEWIDAYTRIRYPYPEMQDQIEWYREESYPRLKQETGIFCYLEEERNRKSTEADT